MDKTQRQEKAIRIKSNEVRILVHKNNILEGKLKKANDLINSSFDSFGSKMNKR